MKENSLWSLDVTLKSFSTLKNNLKTKVLVIGGGITGILCAYELQKRHIEVVLVEQDTIGKGISKNTTAFITAQHELLYQDIVKHKGLEAARTYLKLNLNAVHDYEILNERYDIGFQKCSSVMFASKSKDIVLREKKILDCLGYDTDLIHELPLEHLKIALGIRFNNQGKLHPLKLINALSQDLTIYEHTRVDNIKGNKAYANGHIIEFEKVIVATHYPFINKRGLYFLKLFQKRSYVIALSHQAIADTYCSIDSDLYFRSYKNYLIIGGNDRKVGKECPYTFFDRIQTLFKNKQIEYAWSNQDIITLDQIPYIGRYSRFQKNIFVATGFGLWGFTWAMVSSKVLADMIEGKKEIPLLSPQRFWFNKQLFVNVKTTLKNMLTLRQPRCTHLGVALKYNIIDQVYECPAHGSRFNKNGQILNGPAKKQLNKS